MKFLPAITIIFFAFRPPVALGQDGTDKAMCDSPKKAVTYLIDGVEVRGYGIDGIDMVTTDVEVITSGLPVCYGDLVVYDVFPTNTSSVAVSYREDLIWVVPEPMQPSYNSTGKPLNRQPCAGRYYADGIHGVPNYLPIPND